jgi:hypothetical protein
VQRLGDNLGSFMSSERERDRELFETAYAELLKELPETLARPLARLRAPGMRWVRLSLGIAFLIGGTLSFLPLLGIELLPFGMLLLAQDAPFLHRPVGKATLWLIDKVRVVKARVRGAARATAEAA